ncbi:MAG: hypothetical protein QF903_11115 [Planctomycetota bacterium]|jgi:hypothetical protein|nr:hypothetical protein [Planctomycetota bacterium]MDP6762271.1 hypothetical protein [Planctomycetota bacterium]MDP6990019.1 hypothetical protein [Planctomycetota bacterium]
MSIYEQPRTVTKVDDCLFYHSMDIPGYGNVEGAWDLRKTVDAYLGGVDVAGKRVLEIGKASGFLTFHMEGRGGTVIAHDLSSTDDWDAVPYARRKAPTTQADGEPDPCRDWKEWLKFRQWGIRVINNGFWLAHGANASKARVVTSSVYELPLEIGPVDLTTFGSVLLHLRDPFRALQRALRHTRETVVVTDLAPEDGPAGSAHARFLPDPTICEPFDTWWRLSPELVQRMLAVLGFEDSSVSRAQHSHQGRGVELYTVVARRTVDMEESTHGVDWPEP